MPSVKAELERHQQEHRVIDKFHSKVLHCERQQTNFSGDELNLYQQRLSQLQKVYAELLSTSTKRLSDLDALQNFLAAANAELQWLNDREQVEVGRDWAAKELDLPGIHRYYEVSIPVASSRNYYWPHFHNLAPINSLNNAASLNFQANLWKWLGSEYFPGSFCKLSGKRVLRLSSFLSLFIMHAIKFVLL